MSWLGVSDTGECSSDSRAVEDGKVWYAVSTVVFDDGGCVSSDDLE